MKTRCSLLRHNRPGATLLITVMIVGAVALAISMSIALAGIGDLDMALRTTESQRTLALTEGCLHQSLLNLWGDKSFASNEETFALGKGTCTAKVQAMNEEQNLREVVVQGTIGRFTHTIQAVIRNSGSRLEMLDWRVQ